VSRVAAVLPVWLVGWLAGWVGEWVKAKAKASCRVVSLLHLGIGVVLCGASTTNTNHKPQSVSSQIEVARKRSLTRLVVDHLKPKVDELYVPSSLSLQPFFLIQ
jgi:hypothetical protein